MKVIAIAFASVLLALPAVAQTTIPTTITPFAVNNVPLAVSRVSQNVEPAAIVKLDAREVRIIPAFDIPGGLGQNLSIGLNNFFNIVTPQ
jgi:hypothetical protein